MGIHLITLPLLLVCLFMGVYSANKRTLEYVEKKVRTAGRVGGISDDDGIQFRSGAQVWNAGRHPDFDVPYDPSRKARLPPTASQSPSQTPGAVKKYSAACEQIYGRIEYCRPE